MIKRILPGDQYHQPDEEARPHLIEQYQAEYDHWMKTRENRVPGTPIEHWHALSDTQKAEIRALNIFTVEQIAGLSDAGGQKIMGFNALREKARVFIASGKDAELIGAIRAEAATKEAAMQAQIDELRSIIEGPPDKKVKEKVHA